MRVSAPIAVRSAQAYAARHGILIRSGRALEQLARVTAVVFDKTGTLTEGQVRVVDVRAVANGVSSDDVLRLAAAADGMLDHPVARAVAACARERGIVPLRCAARQAVVGQGVVAEIGGQRVYVGNRSAAGAGGDRRRRRVGAGSAGPSRGARRASTWPGRAGWPASSPAGTRSARRAPGWSPSCAAGAWPRTW